MNLNRGGHASAYQALTAAFMLGFKFLAWINGIGVLVVVFCSIGLIPTELSPFLLRLPLAAFMAGVALCGVGLLWSYLVQTSLFSQLVIGRARRTHWVPLFCAMVAYCLSLVAFVLGCWFTVNLAGLIHQSGYSSGQEGPSPSDQSGDPFGFSHGTKKFPVVL